MLLRHVHPQIIFPILFLIGTLFIIFQIGFKYGSRTINQQNTYESVQLMSEEKRENLIKQVKQPEVPFAKAINNLHITMIQNPVSLRNIYPKRVNMGPCPKLYGKIIVFVAVIESSYKT